MPAKDAILYSNYGRSNKYKHIECRYKFCFGEKCVELNPHSICFFSDVAHEPNNQNENKIGFEPKKRRKKYIEMELHVVCEKTIYCIWMRESTHIPTLRSSEIKAMLLHTLTNFLQRPTDYY